MLKYSVYAGWAFFAYAPLNTSALFWVIMWREYREMRRETRLNGDWFSELEEATGMDVSRETSPSGFL
ncbi:MAG: hypothetical protein GQ524_09075 [Anaerolineales bacterium]|nr:hypothetical protein [Anaerolineales bacterium]